jgi:hypothetical protein
MAMASIEISMFKASSPSKIGRASQGKLEASENRRVL